MNERFERVANVVLIVVAVAIGGSVVRREFFPPARQARSVASTPTFTSSWKEALPIGVAVGDPGALMKVVVISDLECPFCSRFHEVMKDVMQHHGRDVQMVFVHHPLSMHRFALPAARAVECASASGRFSELLDVVYRKQDSLGLKPWGEYALEAGIADTGSITRCAADRSKVPRIEAGSAFAQSIGANATPAVMVNGWLFGSGPPTVGQLEDALDSLKKGAKPFGTK